MLGKLLLFLFILIAQLTSAQDIGKFSSISVSGGPFIVGKDYGIWLSTSFEKKIISKKKFIAKLATQAELYFENSTDNITVYNPTPEQFISDRFYHESNSGLTIKLNYYPFNKIIKGFHIGAGPLLVYSLRTYEIRAQLIQYSPTLSIRMTEMTSDKELLAGYRITAGYDIYFSKHCLAGIRADFLQYHGRDLNSLLGLKVGYRF
jgi:hypothetical protein